ncbi:hypothetical protein PMAYCL1PPCAC_08134, partial [Pristionchus mayeri]
MALIPSTLSASFLHPKTNQLQCVVCGTTTNRSGLISHIIGQEHVKKIKERKLVFPLEPLAFWIHVLRMSQSDAPWFPEEKETIINPDLPLLSSGNARSPLAVLTHFKEVPHACKNVSLVAWFIERKQRIDSVDVGRLMRDQRLRKIITHGECVRCEVCHTRDQFHLDRPDELTAHIITKKHLRGV